MKKIILTLLVLCGVANAQPVSSGGLLKVVHTSQLTGNGTNPSPLGLNPCGSAGQTWIWNGTSWGCAAAGGVTNSAGANIVVKSDGTNLVASSMSDASGTLITSDNWFAVGASANAVIQVGVDTDSIVNAKNGWKVNAYSTGDVFIDHKVFSTGHAHYRIGEGTNGGATNEWLTVTGSNGATSFGSSMSISGTLDLTAHNITGIANGVAATDAAAFGQIGTAVNTAVNGTTTDLAVYSSAHVLGNFAGSSPTACAAGQVVTRVISAATGALTLTCTAIGTAGGTTGTGTANTLAMWTSSTALGNSAITVASNVLTATLTTAGSGTGLIIKNASNTAGTAAFLALQDGTGDALRISSDLGGSTTTFKTVNRNTAMEFWTGASGGAKAFAIDGSQNASFIGGAFNYSRDDLGSHANRPILQITNSSSAGAIAHRADLVLTSDDATPAVQSSLIESEGGNLFLEPAPNHSLFLQPSGTGGVITTANTTIGNAVTQAHTVNGTVATFVASAGATGRYDALSIEDDETGTTTAGDGPQIHFSNNVTNYNGFVAFQNTNTSPAFLDPKIAFYIQNTGTVGAGNVTDRFEVHYNGTNTFGSALIQKNNTGLGGLGYEVLTLENTSDTVLMFKGAGTNEKSIYFTNPTMVADGGIVYDNPSLVRGLQFRTGGNTNRLTIDSSGNVGILTGALDMGTHQIHSVVDPTSVQDAATKNYVDSASINAPVTAITISGTVNALTGFAGYKYVRLTATSTTTVNGIDSTGVSEGRELCFIGTNTGLITFNYQNASAAVNDRMTTPGHVAWRLTANTSQPLCFVYTSTNQWEVSNAMSDLGTLVVGSFSAASNGNFSGVTGTQSLSVMNGSGANNTLTMHHPGTALTTGGYTIIADHVGSYNTTAGALTATGISMIVSSTVSSGANTLTDRAAILQATGTTGVANLALELNASGGSVSNIALQIDAGDVITNGNNTFGDSLTDTTSVNGNFVVNTDDLSVNASTHAVGTSGSLTVGGTLLVDNGNLATFSGGASGINEENILHLEYPDEWMQTQAGATIATGSLIGTSYQLQFSGSGTGLTTPTQVSNRNGIAALTTGLSTAGGYSTIISDTQGVDFADGDWDYEWVGNWPILASSSSASATEYASLIGFFDSPTTVNQTDGCYFAYDKGNFMTGGPNTGFVDALECWCASNGTRTKYLINATGNSDETFPLGTGTIVAGTFYRLKVHIKASTRAEFYRNGTKVCDINTNVPTGTTRRTGMGFSIFSNAATGTGVRNIETDWTKWDVTKAAVRNP